MVLVNESRNISFGRPCPSTAILLPNASNAWLAVGLPRCFVENICESKVNKSYWYISICAYNWQNERYGRSASIYFTIHYSSCELTYFVTFGFRVIITSATKSGGILDSPCLFVCLCVRPSVRLSVCLSVNLSWPPCSIYNSGWILFIFGINNQ